MKREECDVGSGGMVYDKEGIQEWNEYFGDIKGDPIHKNTRERSPKIEPFLPTVKELIIRYNLSAVRIHDGSNYSQLNFNNSSLYKLVIKEESIERGLRCPIDKNEIQIFFSLTDYRNNLFTSNDPRKIMEFYDGFHSRDELIEWMKERPKGVPWIREVSGQKDIIVVIPTADFNGKYAKECRDNIFKGLHLIFVESGGKNDFYFNFAHYVNTGIKKALEYNPKWIIYSGDDMYKIDDVEQLRISLSAIPENVDVVYAVSPENRFSDPTYIGRPTFIYGILNFIRGKKGIPKNIQKKFHLDLEIISDFFIKPRFLKPLVKFLIVRPLKKNSTFIHISSFGIFSSKFIKNSEGQIFDEVYINANEDIDLSYRISTQSINTTQINYKIGDLIGKTLGLGIDRYLRGISGSVYFFSKWHANFE